MNAPHETLGHACSSCGVTSPDGSARFCYGCGHALPGCTTLEGGRYRLLKPIGSGGMGAVYLAEDTRLKMQRAIKLLSPPPNLPAAELVSLRARLVQEARAAQVLGELTHHVVRVFDVGYCEDHGEPFLVMELLDGETLTERMARGLSVAESVSLARTVAETLALAHTRGMVHRDLKPDNIMLARRGDDAAFVKLLDFGLVKLERPEVHTETGRMMGTLPYMPPEQLRGAKIDARVDVWGLGAILYECLAGVRANPGQSQQEVFAVLLDSGVKPLAAHRPELPPALLDLVDRCLSLDRADRPKDAGVFLAELNGAPVTRSPEAPIERARLRWVPAALGVAALLALGIVLLSPSEAPRPPETTVATVHVAPLAPPAAEVGARPADAQRVDAQRVDVRVHDAGVRDMTVDAASAPAPTGQRRLRGVGRLLRYAEGPPTFERVICGAARAGDALLSARWSVPGYRGGRCAGRCVDALPKALRSARDVGESMRLRLKLSRGGAPLSARCVVKP